MEEQEETQAQRLTLPLEDHLRQVKRLAVAVAVAAVTLLREAEVLAALYHLTTHTARQVYLAVLLEVRVQLSQIEMESREAQLAQVST
jgi:hypothetical protein